MEERKRAGQKENDADTAEARKSPGHRGEEESRSRRDAETSGSRGSSEKRSSSTKKK